MAQAVDTTVDSARALQLVRIGWAVAELRGRTAIGAEGDAGTYLKPPPTRTSHALPLAQERSSLERLYEARAVFTALCTGAQLSVSSAGMVDSAHNGPSTPSISGWDRVAELSNQVPLRRSDIEWNAKWNAFTEALYQFDERLQDELATEAFGSSSAYQLGRGLAETAWTLDPKAADGSFNSWEYLLGPQRTLAITDLVDRLTPVAVSKEVAQTVKGSLATWQRLVEQGRPTDASAVVRLRQQAELWRDLLLSGADPAAIVPPAATISRMSAIGPLLRMLAPQIGIGVVSTIILGAAAWFLTSHHSTSGPIGSIIAALSVLGVTASTVSARAKSSANDMVGRLKGALSADLMVEHATILPDDAASTGHVSVAKPGQIAEPVSVRSLSNQLTEPPPVAPLPLKSPSRLQIKSTRQGREWGNWDLLILGAGVVVGIVVLGMAALAIPPFAGTKWLWSLGLVAVAVVNLSLGVLAAGAWIEIRYRWWSRLHGMDYVVLGLSLFVIALADGLATFWIFNSTAGWARWWLLFMVVVAIALGAGWSRWRLWPRHGRTENRNQRYQPFALLSGLVGGGTGMTLIALVLAGSAIYDNYVQVTPGPTIPALAHVTGPYLAIGDSYSAGEGNRPFVAGTAQTNCDRSISTAYPVLLGVRPITFRACSGAIVADVAERPAVRNGIVVPTQIDGMVHPDVRLVTLTIGGNDALFSKVAISCFAKANCLTDTFPPNGVAPVVQGIPPGPLLSSSGSSHHRRSWGLSEPALRVPPTRLSECPDHRYRLSVPSTFGPTELLEF